MSGPIDLAEGRRLLEEVKAGLQNFAYGPGSGTVSRLAKALSTSEARAQAAEAERDALKAEVETLTGLLNSPETADFVQGVMRETPHQRERWGPTTTPEKPRSIGSGSSATSRKRRRHRRWLATL